MAAQRQSTVVEKGGYTDMTDPLEVGDLVEYYAPAHEATVVGEVIQLPNGHKQVRIKILDSPLPELRGQKWYIGHRKLLKAGGRPRAGFGGDPDYSEPLVEIRDRVLEGLPWGLRPLGCTKRPRKELHFAYEPEGAGYRVHVSPKGLELKLTLNVKDDQKRKASYAALQAKEDAIRQALGEVSFNWTGSPPRVVFEEIAWPGEDGPRPQDIDLTLERLKQYITTLQSILNEAHRRQTPHPTSAA